MATEHEKYQVETEYKVDDKSTAPAARIERAFKALKNETHKLREKFSEFRNESRFTAAAMLGVGFGLGAWVEKTKEAVTEFGRAKKALTGLFAETLQWPAAVSNMDRFRASTKLADEVTEQLEETVSAYGGSLEEAAQGFRGLTASVGPAHLKPKQLMDLYEQVAATAKATSTDVGMAAEQVGRAIMTGSVRPVGVLGKELYQALHAHGKLTKAMGMQGRLQLVQKMLQGQKPIAEAMSQGLPDALRKIQMSVQQIFRHVGTPLFGAIAKELNAWAQHLTKAKDSAKPLAEVFSEKLVRAFHVAKDITSFLVDHWKQIAVIWGSFKLAGMAGGAAGFLTNIGGAIGGNVGQALGVFSKGLGSAAAKLGLFAAAATAAYMAGEALGDYLASKMAKRTEIEGHGVQMTDAAKMLSKIATLDHSTPKTDRLVEKALKDLAASGTLQNGKLDRGAMMTNIKYLNDDDKRLLSNYLGIGNKNLPVSAMATTQFADALGAKLEPLLAQFGSAPKKVEKATEVDASNLKTKGVQIGPFTGQINITQKFDDVDPDRVWVATRRGIQENAERAVRSMHADPWSE